MSVILAVRFKEVGKIHYFQYFNDDISVGDIVIAETKKGIQNGKVISIKENFSETNDFQTERIIRKATPEDLESVKKKKQEEKEACEICKSKIKLHKLKMKVIDVEYMFDRNKIIFYFISESRIDFRNLVRDLAHAFKARIELRQVGIRDEAKILGGLGICGKSLCCETFLNEFPLSLVKMAKDQGVSLSPSKLSGICGRLKCCLNYEQDTYLDLLEKMPQVGDIIETQEGEVVVLAKHPISSTLKVQIKDGNGNIRVKNIKVDDVIKS